MHFRLSRLFLFFFSVVFLTEVFHLQAQSIRFEPWEENAKADLISDNLKGWLKIETISADQFPVQLVFYYPPSSSKLIDVAVEQQQQTWPVWEFLSSIGDQPLNRIEVRNHHGKIIDQLTFPSSEYKSQSSRYQPMALATDEPEADRYFRDCGYTMISVSNKFPTLVEAIQGVGAVWISSKTVQQSSLTPQILRRLLLADISITARATTLSSLSQMIDLPPNSAVLSTPFTASESEMSPARKVRPFLFFEGGQSHQSPFLLDSKIPNGKNKKLIRVSMLFLGTYLLGILVLFLFVTKKINQIDPLIWWLGLPLLSITYAAVGLWGISSFLPQNPTLFSLDSIYSFQDWPEAYLETHTTTVTSKKQLVQWNFLPNMEIKPNSPVNPYWTRRWGFTEQTSETFHKEPSRTTLLLSCNRGTVTRLRTHGWIANSIPCVLISSNQLQINAAFDETWVWNGLLWKNWGSTKSGDILNLSQQVSIETKNSAPVYYSVDNDPLAQQSGTEWIGFPERLPILTNQQRRKDPLITEQGIFIGLRHGSVYTQVEKLKEDVDLQQSTLFVHGFSLRWQ